MERITISIDDELLAELDGYLERRGYGNRSEAFRDLLREKMQQDRLAETAEGTCVGSLTYIYDHGERELSRRLTHAQHDHHDLAVSTLHVHLDHKNCLETVVLRGPVAQVRRFADSVIAQPGVRYGDLHLVPAEEEIGDHAHGDAAGRPHVHSHPHR